MNHSGLEPKPPVVGMVIMCYHCIRRLLVNLYNIWPFLAVFILKFTFLNSPATSVMAQDPDLSIFVLMLSFYNRKIDYTCGTWTETETL